MFASYAFRHDVNFGFITQHAIQWGGLIASGCRGRPDFEVSEENDELPDCYSPEAIRFARTPQRVVDKFRQTLSRGTANRMYVDAIKKCCLAHGREMAKKIRKLEALYVYEQYGPDLVYKVPGPTHNLSSNRRKCELLCAGAVSRTIVSCDLEGYETEPTTRYNVLSLALMHGRITPVHSTLKECLRTLGRGGGHVACNPLGAIVDELKQLTTGGDEGLEELSLDDFNL